MPGPLLMQVGNVAFELVPFNTNQYDHKHSADFASKPVLGIMPPLEHVGEGAESWSIKAKLFPHKWGGLGHLADLYAMRAAGDPVYMMRGDGAVMGWVVVTDVTETSTYLDRNGIGKVIEVDINLKNSGPPAGGNFFGALQSLFLWAL